MKKIISFITFCLLTSISAFAYSGVMLQHGIWENEQNYLIMSDLTFIESIYTDNVAQ